MHVWVSSAKLLFYEAFIGIVRVIDILFLFFRMTDVGVSGRMRVVHR